MEIINFKTKYELEQKVFRVCCDGDVVRDEIRGVVFTNEPFQYVTTCGWHSEDEIFASFEEALVVAQPLWLANQKKVCKITNEDEQTRMS